MAIKLNFNICDNAAECSGISVCPTGAIYWNEKALNQFSKNGSICVNNQKCISCGNCVGEDGCPVGAISLIDAEESINIEDNIDITKVEELFVERYGAMPIDEELCIDYDEINKIIENNLGIVLVEEFSNDSIQCLLSSIPIASIVEELKVLSGIDDIKFYRIDMSEKVFDEYELPRLNVYQNGNMIFQIQGFIDNTQFSEMQKIFQERFN